MTGLPHDSPLLLEEAGADIEFRRDAATGFTPLETPPQRLGFTVIAAGSDRLEVRIVKGQGSAGIRVTPCLPPSDVQFFDALAELHTRYLRTGSEQARTATPALHWLARAAEGPKRAWLLNTYANVRLSAGEPSEAATAFLASAETWRMQGRPDRAATALMAAGENLSRAGRFDEAQPILQQAGEALRASGLEDFALRSDGALCTIASRRGLLDQAIACERRVVAGMERRGNHQEAAARHISLGNLLFRVGKSETALEHFQAADRNKDLLTPVVAARLHKALGTYLLYTGDLPGAASEFGAASARLLTLGHPAEGAEIDLKLASLAEMAGASLERERLLERAAATLSKSASPALLASTRVSLARARLQRGEAATALVDLESANVLCNQLGKYDCLNRIALAEIEANLKLGRTDVAAAIHRNQFGARNDASLDDIRAEVALAAAEIELAAGRPQQAVRALPASSWVAGDPQLEVARALLHARADLALDDVAAAAAQLDDTLRTQARQASEWPSAALRLSARNRLAKLQNARFDVFAANDADAIDGTGVAAMASTIAAASAGALFRSTASAELPTPVRKALSAAIESNVATDQRELFLTLANQPPALPRTVGIDIAAMPTAPLRGRILLPLAGTSEFRLIAVHGGEARVCRRWPLQRYEALAAEFEQALQGKRADLFALDAAASDWNDAVAKCFDTHEAEEWTVVATLGTRALPWAWIAARGPGTRVEPTVSNVFEMPERNDPPVSAPASAALIDLDMSTAAPLPFARYERESLQTQFDGRHMGYRVLSGATLDSRTILEALAAADFAHVIGHANPAAYGQLYQGLWFESGGKPTLLSYPEIAAARMDAQLIVLSACGTDATTAADFGATSRLAEAFIAAGAHRVVAASNPLSDSAAPYWTKAFYASLWAKGDAASAAREARLSLRRTPHFRHPKFWAGIEFYRTVGREHPDLSAHDLITPLVIPTSGVKPR